MGQQPTLRQNGKEMLTVRVEHHVDRSDAIDLLAMASDDIRGARLTKPRVIEALRDYFYLNGESECDPDDFIPYGEREELRTWADRELSRLFPDWK